MRDITKIAAVACFALSLFAPAAQAEPVVPLLNVGPTCRALDPNDKTIQIDTERCLKTENDARDQLVRQWADYPVADRSLCIQTATITNMESYVDLITCLEMKRDVARLPADRGLRTAPAGLNTAR